MGSLQRVLSSVLTLLGVISSLSAGELDGVWRSEGYGSVFVFRGTKLKAYEVTATTCVPAFNATVTRDRGDAEFKTDEGDLYIIRSGKSEDQKRLHAAGAVSDIRVDRITSLPAACKPGTPDTVMGNFEVFSRTWAENYIAFDLKHADWDSIVSRNRAKLTPDSTAPELFEILKGMIQPFGDAHTAIYAPKIKKQFEGIRPGTDRVAKEGLDKFEHGSMPKLLAITDKAYLEGPVRNFCRKQVQYGHTKNGIAYLRILAFGGYAGKSGFAENAKALESALDAIFSDSTPRALILDLRINFGGDDPLGLAVAARLATVQYLAFAKQARADDSDRNKWTETDNVFVKPSLRPGCHGPVVELIGPLTISAGETFTQALMGRTPRVVRVGENTQGVFSDVSGRHLPNGWTFGLPNEVFRTPEGKTFDGDGIPPDFTVPVFADTDIRAGRDPAMEKALDLLSKVR